MSPFSLCPQNALVQVIHVWHQSICSKTTRNVSSLVYNIPAHVYLPGPLLPRRGPHAGSLYPFKTCQWYLSSNLQRLHVQNFDREVLKRQYDLQGTVFKVLWLVVKWTATLSCKMELFAGDSKNTQCVGTCINESMWIPWSLLRSFFLFFFS